MSTKTYSKHDIAVEMTVAREPFLYESALRQYIDAHNAFILATTVAVDPGAALLGIKTADGHDYRILADPPEQQRQWLAIDSATGMQYFARRRGQVVRDGFAVPKEFLSGVAVSQNFSHFILLDAHGRRAGKRAARQAIAIEEAWIDVLSLDK